MRNGTEVLGMAANRTYIAIDLKSFYASVECVERGLNPLTTNLVVADREDKLSCGVTASKSTWHFRQSQII